MHDPDSGSRADVVNAIVRPAGDVSGGSRYEFPGSLASQKGSYDSLVIGESESQLDPLKDDKPKLESTASGPLFEMAVRYVSRPGVAAVDTVRLIASEQFPSRGS